LEWVQTCCRFWSSSLDVERRGQQAVHGKSGQQGCTQSKARVFNDGTVRRLETRRWMLDRG